MARIEYGLGCIATDTHTSALCLMLLFVNPVNLKCIIEINLPQSQWRKLLILHKSGLSVVFHWLVGIAMFFSFGFLNGFCPCYSYSSDGLEGDEEDGECKI